MRMNARTLGESWLLPGYCIHPHPPCIKHLSPRHANEMKEEAQGFPTAWGSVGFPLHPKALGVSENDFFFGKRKLTMGINIKRSRTKTKAEEMYNVMGL